MSTSENIARAFHEAYERLAPAHGYKTREASAVPWEEVPASNKALMIATVGALLDQGFIVPAAVSTHMHPHPRRFHLIRDVDVTGVTGTGVVADGVLWRDRTATVRWGGDMPSTVNWGDIAHAMRVHGHGGATRVEWLDY